MTYWNRKNMYYYWSGVFPGVSLLLARNFVILHLQLWGLESQLWWLIWNCLHNIHGKNQEQQDKLQVEQDRLQDRLKDEQDRLKDDQDRLQDEQDRLQDKYSTNLK